MHEVPPQETTPIPHVETIVTIAQTVVVVIVGASIVAGVKVKYLWGIYGTMQLLGFMETLQVNMPGNLRTTLILMRGVTTFHLIDPEKVARFFFGQDTFRFLPLTAEFKTAFFPSTHSIGNLGLIFFVLLFIGLSIGISFIPWKCKKFATFLRQNFRFRFAIRTFLILCLPLSVTTILNIS